MAKEVVGSIAGAVADKAVSKIVDSLGRQTPVGDKLQQLERLCMRVRSTVEVSEKHDIENASLLEWREKLKKAVALGDEVLLSFQQQQLRLAVPTDDAQGPSIQAAAAPVVLLCPSQGRPCRAWRGASAALPRRSSRPTRTRRSWKVRWRR